MNWSQKLMRRPAVEERTGLKKTTIYKLIRAGDFPKPIQLTGAPGKSRCAVAWRESDIEAWIAKRANIRRAA
jgi:prophage regulatory protein